MSQVTRIYKVPIRMKIWRSREAYIGIIDDAATIELLQPYIGRRVILEIRAFPSMRGLPGFLRRGWYT
ncbi:MAG: hypothetical protein RXQ94_08570 [Caldivirga sp.]